MHSDTEYLFVRYFSVVFVAPPFSDHTMSSSLSHTDAVQSNEDHLDVDPSVPGQQFVCLSFVSPEKVLPQKEAYFRKAFWGFLKERHDEIDFSVVKDFEALYDTFLHDHEQELEEKFHAENAFQTSIRGLKVRGTYNTQQEADIRAKVLQKLDRSHHVFVAPVGYWLPWDPAADSIQDQVYQEEQLNELMKNYKVNEMKRDTFYEQQKEERKRTALEENEKKKQTLLKEAEATTSDAASDEPPLSPQTLFDIVEDAGNHTKLRAHTEDTPSS